MGEELTPHDVAFLKMLLLSNGSKRAKEINKKIKSPEGIQGLTRKGRLVNTETGIKK